LNASDYKELHFLLDRDGGLIAFQEKDRSWAGALAFSSDELARKFIASSHLEVAEIAAISVADGESVAALIQTIKRRPIRYVLLDLDYHTGHCHQVDFEGDRLGDIKERQFVAEPRHG
jgi:hypothetical protein